MVNSTADFEAAYDQIRILYKKHDLSAGKLIRIGIRNKWNYVLADGNQAGVAFNFTADHSVYGSVIDPEKIANLQPYIGKNLFEFAQALLCEKDIQTRSVCLAALNALSQPLLERDRLIDRGIQSLETENYEFIKEDDVTTIVGFGGVYGNIYNKCQELHITDMRPIHTLQTIIVDNEVRYGPPNIQFHTADENEDVISKSDVVFITGCTMVNGTFEKLIHFAKKARVIGMYGPSAAVIPEFLFERGINWISSDRIMGRYMNEPQFEYSIDLFASNKNIRQPYFIHMNQDKE